MKCRIIHTPAFDSSSISCSLCLEKLFVQLTLCQSQSMKALLSHPCGLAFGHYFAALRLLAALALRAGLRPLLRCACPAGWPSAITSLRFVYSLRSPCGLAFGHYFAALRLLAALALRAGLRPLLRYASFTGKQR